MTNTLKNLVEKLDNMNKYRNFSREIKITKENQLLWWNLDENVKNEKIADMKILLEL